MAVIQFNMFSQTLNRSVSLAAVIPIEIPAQFLPDKFKTVYLLHGYCGNHLDWLMTAPITDFAAQHNVVFIMPAGENSFFLNDEIRGAMYEDFICKEVPAKCRKMFNLSDKAEDTSIGGLSMGGYGAMHSGLAHPETFGNVIALSSALITDQVAGMHEGQGNGVAPFSYYKHTFGDPATVLGSHSDPKALAKNLIESGVKLPNIYMACGSEDFLVENNRNLHNYLNELGFPHEYAEGPGVHDWVFWRAYLKNALVWLDGINNK